MINKKIIALKQSNTRGVINRKLDGLSQDQLSEIGMVYEVPFSDGRKTTAVMLTFEGVKTFLEVDDVDGIKEVIRKHGAEIEGGMGIVNEHGILVRLNLYEQVALLRAIVEKKPELASVLGFYNLRGSRKVYKVMRKAEAYNKLNAQWIWTGQRHIQGKHEEGLYPEEAIVSLGDLGSLEGNLFCCRFVDDIDFWLAIDPDGHYNNGVVVLGAQKI